MLRRPSRRWRRQALDIIPPMLVHPQFDPIALDLDRFGRADRRPLVRHRPTWSAFALFLCLAAAPGAPIAAIRRPAGWTRRDIEDLLFYGVLGAVDRRPARLRAVLQARRYYLQPSARDLRRVEGRHVLPWRPARRDGWRWPCSRAPAPAALLRGDRSRRPAACPLGLAAGRIGNFINGELWGRPLTPACRGRWSFPIGRRDVPRHPSQLYQFALEGIAAFRHPLAVCVASRARTGQVSGTVSHGLWRAPLHRRVLPRARQLPRPAHAST